ncbi:hypothetical protein PAMA_007576 [Pampus argenteus]
MFPDDREAFESVRGFHEALKLKLEPQIAQLNLYRNTGSQAVEYKELMSVTVRYGTFLGPVRYFSRFGTGLSSVRYGTFLGSVRYFPGFGTGLSSVRYRTFLGSVRDIPGFGTGLYSVQYGTFLGPVRYFSRFGTGLSSVRYGTFLGSVCFMTSTVTVINQNRSQAFTCYRLSRLIRCCAGTLRNPIYHLPCGQPVIQQSLQTERKWVWELCIVKVVIPKLA